MTDETLIKMTRVDLLKLLSRGCDKAGGQSAWAAKHDIARSVVSDTLAGRREPSEAIINALGFVKVVRYVQMRGEGA